MLTESTKQNLLHAFRECGISEKSKRSGFLYVIIFPQAGQFKVGLTKSFNDERFRQIQSAAAAQGFPVGGMTELKFAMVADMKQQEKTIHQLLGRWHADNYNFSFGGYSEFFWLKDSAGGVDMEAVEVLSLISGEPVPALVSKHLSHLWTKTSNLSGLEEEVQEQLDARCLADEAQRKAKANLRKRELELRALQARRERETPNGVFLAICVFIGFVVGGHAAIAISEGTRAPSPVRGLIGLVGIIGGPALGAGFAHAATKKTS